MRRAFLTALAVMTSSAATAGSYCELDGSEMFTCTFNGGAKAVEVCDAFWMDGDMASYGFFKSSGEVEKEIITDKASLLYNEGTGMGTMMSESVTFQTEDGYGYEVFWWAEQGDVEASGGVNVHKDGSEIASLSCDPGSVQQNLGEFIMMIDNAQVSP
ncbi:hypothetical protein NAS141_03973 [Sulfitobacter sp. NAS-14.1]|uniref:hypothetical protein n=1 Tax=Sulfitobacter sp. (strain NAS-14.1) TaxID=314267 RepID=UPI000066BED7|nr:hypothetical protein [Sulfitobacter sp. NAS-14.1]EAP78886.1 hypothetical protein NAS141_03973 [Sulfitobacter sp. NAS-14.1]